jgi:ataxia telangiectasia mutated family protein
LKLAKTDNQVEVKSTSGKTKDVSEADEAERALTVIRQKLSQQLSAEAAVKELVYQATDKTNLAMIFCGWSPFY